MNKRTQIGAFECWLEDGNFHVYSHRVGQALGFSTKMNSEETMQLLEWLSQNHEEISLAIHSQAKKQSRFVSKNRYGSSF